MPGAPAIWHSQGFVCCWCNNDLILGTATPLTITVLFIVRYGIACLAASRKIQMDKKTAIEEIEEEADADETAGRGNPKT